MPITNPSSPLPENLFEPPGQTANPSAAQQQRPDPDNPPWGIGIALVIWIASVALQIFVSIPLLLTYAAAEGITPTRPDYQEAISTFATTNQTAVFLQIFSLLPAHLLTLILIWAIVTRFGKRSFGEIFGLTRDGFPIWASIVIGVVLFGVGSGLAKLIGGDTPTQLEQIINSSLATRYLVAFLAVATAPLVEELVYRGVIYSALRRAVGAVAAVIFVLALFTIVHVPQYWPNHGVILAVGLLSVSLTIIRAYTGRLLPCVVIHLVFNGVQAILLIFTRPPA